MIRRVLGWALCAGWLPATALADRPVVEIRTDQGSYGFGEPVWLYVTVGNEGPSPLHVENPRCSRTSTRIEIQPHGGDVLPMSGPPMCATTVFERIPPGDDMVYAFELLEFYGVDGDASLPFGFLPPGHYDVAYRSHDWRSPMVSFAVDDLAPSDSEAFHAYMEAIAAAQMGGLSDATDRYRAFVHAYPTSPFAAALLCRAGVVSDLFLDSERARRDFEQLILLYPESGYTTVAVQHLAHGMSPDRSDGLRFLRSLPGEIPGTLAANYAARVLARLDRETVSREG